MQMYSHQGWLPAINSLLHNDLVLPCHDSICTSKPSVKHEAILLPKAAPHLFEQGLGAAEIQIGPFDRIYAKLCVHCRILDWHVKAHILALQMKGQNLDYILIIRIIWPHHFCSRSQCSCCSCPLKWPVGVAVRSNLKWQHKEEEGKMDWQQQSN